MTKLAKFVWLLWELVSLALAMALMLVIAHYHGVWGVWKAVGFLFVFHLYYRWRFGRWLN